MKKNWKIIFGAMLIISGIGQGATDLKSGLIDIIFGVIFIVWWNWSRKKAADTPSKSVSQQTTPVSSVSQIGQSPEKQPERGTISQPVSALIQPTVPTIHEDISTPAKVSESSLTQTASPTYQFSIDVPGFKSDNDDPQNLDFYRDKLNSKKALTSFDTYVVLDCETTGLSPKSDEIIEIALMKYVKGELVDTFSSLVAPSHPIPTRITEITGITNADLENAPRIQDIISQVWHFIDGFVLVGHNIPFDIGFLKKEFGKNGFEGRFNYVDTLQLARSAFPDFPNHKLSTCIERLSLSDEQTHRALDDVVCTQRLLEKCLPVLLERKEQELADRRAKKLVLNSKPE